jgi:hypothetical protein
MSMFQISQLPKSLARILMIAAITAPGLNAQDTPSFPTINRSATPTGQAILETRWIAAKAPQTSVTSSPTIRLDETSPPNPAKGTAPVAGTGPLMITMTPLPRKASDTPVPAMPVSIAILGRAKPMAVNEASPPPPAPTASPEQEALSDGESASHSTARMYLESRVRNAAIAREASPRKTLLAEIVNKQSLAHEEAMLPVDAPNASAADAGNNKQSSTASALIQLSDSALRSGQTESKNLPELKTLPPDVVTLQRPKIDVSAPVEDASGPNSDEKAIVNFNFRTPVGLSRARINSVSFTEDVGGGTSLDRSRYDVNAIVGPLTNTNELFSQLDVPQRFEAYAAYVPSNRTRAEDVAMYEAYVQSQWPWETYTWISPAFYYKPLYFEQPNLERYGLGTHRWLQPAASSIHFFGTIPLLPYKVLTQHPREKYYTLGNNRPGNCVPVQRRTILGQSYPGEVKRFWDPSSGY